MAPSQPRHEYHRTLRGGGAVSASEAFWFVIEHDETRRNLAICRCAT